MYRRKTSALLAELEGLGKGWKFWERDPAPSPAAPPAAQPSRLEVKPPEPPPLPDEQLQTLARKSEDLYQQNT